MPNTEDCRRQMFTNCAGLFNPKPFPPASGLYVYTKFKRLLKIRWASKHPRANGKAVCLSTWYGLILLIANPQSEKWWKKLEQGKVSEQSLKKTTGRSQREEHKNKTGTVMLLRPASGCTLSSELQNSNRIVWTQGWGLSPSWFSLQCDDERSPKSTLICTAASWLSSRISSYCLQTQFVF